MIKDNPFEENPNPLIPDGECRKCLKEITYRALICKRCKP